ncbi:hypothetical protein L3X38_027956 [Prunus dulcis]|uniref:Uncharacterized protein n=1 Tax=Prunus dulcis TaxID=3755 RepID=A0AAD4VNZ0_PRUDU|nr:hypothetical protein L3X38_027956 [Prunus dulcis]
MTHKVTILDPPLHMGKHKIEQMNQHLRKYPIDIAHNTWKYPTSVKISSTLSKPRQTHVHTGCSQHLVKTKTNPYAQVARNETPFRPAVLPISFLSKLWQEKPGRSKRCLTQNEEVQPQENLGTQKALSLCAWIGEVSLNRIEWKRVKKNGEHNLVKLELPMPIKGGISYLANWDIQREQASSLTVGTFNSKQCSPFFFFSLLENHPKCNKAFVKRLEESSQATIPLFPYQTLPNLPLPLL